MAWWLWGLLLGAAAVLVAAAVDWWRIGHVPKHFTPIQPHLGNTPTIYIHGYSGNRYSFGHLLGRLHRAGIAQKAMVIHVKRNGQLRVQGHLLDTKNPTIQVIFCHSRAHLATELTWLHQILVLLKHNGVHRVNLVGHSMGAVLVMLAAMQLPTKDTPRINKIVTLAGPFNDIELGKDTDEILVYEWGPRGPFRQAPIYHYIAEKVHDLPRDIHILNIAGDIFTIPTRHDDGVIAVQSAFALRWLLPKAGIDYQEVLIRGVRGAHSLLHENKLVDDNIVRFLYAS